MRRATALIPPYLSLPCTGSSFLNNSAMNIYEVIVPPSENEFVRAHTLSTFALLLNRAFPQTTLDIQHRYPEEICEWILEHFYKGHLKTSLAKVQNPGANTERVRNGWRRSLTSHGRTASRAQRSLGLTFNTGTTSQSRPATLCKTGRTPTPASNTSRHSTSRESRRRTSFTWSFTRRRLPGKLLTVDIFQGQEGSVVVLDTVVGSVFTLKELAKHLGRVSSHAAKAARLNVGITRAVDTCMVLYNGDFLARFGSKTALAAMMENLERRNLVVREMDVKDKNPLLAAVRGKNNALFTSKQGKMTPTQRLEMMKGEIQEQAYSMTVDLRQDNLDPKRVL